MLLEKFVSGYGKFEKEVFPQQKQAFAELAEGQQPPMLLITCSDSRIVPNLVLQADPGDLFILRNAGNIVPPFGPNVGAEAAAIEYAVAVLKVGHVVVCGHSRCGAMQALLAPESVASLPAVKQWIGFSAAARAAAEGEAGETSLDRLIERNVLLQLDHLRTHPAVARGLAGNTLRIHGWVYRFETGELLAHDPETHAFRKLGS
jgi:carbonic anhydrase